MSGKERYRFEKAIVALLQSSSVVEASKISGISKESFFRYLADDGFKEQYRQAKLRLIDGAVNSLRLKCKGAVDVLWSVATDAAQPAASRVAAARAIISLAIEAGDIEDVKARLQEIENRTIQAGPATWNEVSE